MVTNPRVLFILPLPPPVHGSSVMSRYIKDFQERTKCFEGEYVNLSTSRSIDEIGKISFRKALRFLATYFRVLGLLLTRRYDLCYLAVTCHGKGFLKDMPYVLLCKLFGKKVVIHQHNKGMSRDQNRGVYRLLFRLTYKDTKVILLSWLLYPDISRFVKREQIIICPNGIPQRKTCEKFRAKNAVPELLYLSNLIESKGVFVLLDSCRILKDRGINFICNLVGGASKEISFARMAEEIKKRGLEEIVYCHGPKYDDEKERFFAQADLFVAPTYNDCFPVVLLEAMQYRLPIVSTYEGAVPDMVAPGINGLLCHQRQSGELADALSYLIIHEKERLEMGEQGYKLFSEHYTLEVYEKNIQRIIYRICMD